MPASDRDGRLTIKRGRKQPPPDQVQRQAIGEIAVPMFGYKNHLGIDRTHGFIRRFTSRTPRGTTAANRREPLPG